MPEWNLIIASPERCREIAAVAANAHFDVSWQSRDGELWTVWIFCTAEQAEAMEGSTVEECRA
jgi:hypothetical protein